MNERDRLFLKHILDAIVEQDLPTLKLHTRRILEGMQGPTAQS